MNRTDTLRENIIAREGGKAGLRGKINAMCACEGCNSPSIKRGLCNKHYIRLRRNGMLISQRREKGTGTIKSNGYIAICREGRIKYEHVWIAEAALGRAMKFGEEVHHVDGNPANNDPSNLIICPSRSYHKLLHKRERERAKS